MIKAAFFDYDSTLYSHTTNQIPPSALQAICQLQEKGIKVCLCTGRMKWDIGNVPFGFDAYATYNGQHCEAGGMPARRAYFNTEEIAAAVQLAAKGEIPIMFILEEYLFVSKLHEDMADFYALRHIGTPEVRLPSKKETEKILKLVAYVTPAQDSILDEQLPGLPRARFGPYAVDILPGGCSKANGVEAILNHYGFTREEAIAFGDNYNDLEMLDYAGIGVAMATVRTRPRPMPTL